MSEDKQSSDEQTENQAQYEQSLGLAEETTMINLYAGKDMVETWTQEADDQNFSTRNKYLLSLIEEARAYRQSDFTSAHRAEQRVQQLQSEVDRLKDELQQERQKQSGRTEVDDIDFLHQFLDTQYKSLEELLQEIVESGVLNDLIRQRVEDQLYYMASRNEVEFERGWGWRLTDTGGDH